LVTTSLLLGGVIGLAVLVVLAGAVAALLSRFRRGKDAGPIDMLAFYLIMAAGLILNIVVVSIACCWSSLRGKPLPPPRQG
jgi:apolipoprotein N-acyltransferase